MKQIDHCKKCLNREISRTEGILCGLTHQKPNFGDSCPDYKADVAQIKRLERFEKSVNKSEVAKHDGFKYLSIGIPAFVIGIIISVMYDSIVPKSVFHLFSIIGLILGFLFIVFGVLKLYQAYGDFEDDNTDLDEIDLL
ncbi:MAG: hypothetical protein ABJG68_12265 [Crocinitomicaceae bacterium]